MFEFSLKNRIAFYYIIMTALLMAAVFVGIYSIVSFTVNKRVNDDINYELKEYMNKVYYDTSVHLRGREELRQREHNEVSVNPKFLELTDADGVVLESSENLKVYRLNFEPNAQKPVFTEWRLSGQLIRQIQKPLVINSGKIVGYLNVAVSLEEARAVMTKLQQNLLVIYPIALIFLFVAARFIAGQSIMPIRNIIKTSNAITQENLDERIELPKNKDELYTLSDTINKLLDRIQSAVEREKRFTSDASHELRTPLAVIKGTLEVLIRKPRTREEYEDKIRHSISEVDRLNTLVEELLLLARFENQQRNMLNEEVYLNGIIQEIILRFAPKSNSQHIDMVLEAETDFYMLSDNYLLSIIFSNLLSNSLKYSQEYTTIRVRLFEYNQELFCQVIDEGFGISAQDMDKIFEMFYRSNENNHPEIKGTGLGLSIVKRLSVMLNISLNVHSTEGEGTTFTLKFNNAKRL